VGELPTDGEAVGVVGAVGWIQMRHDVSYRPHPSGLYGPSSDTPRHFGSDHLDTGSNLPVASATGEIVATRKPAQDPSSVFGPGFGPIDGGEDDSSYEPLASVVSRHVREAILDGRLPPGSRIRQEAIAQRLGTSRIPVREALRQLESEGLVTLVPHSGARVAVMDFEEYSELYRVREAVEPIAIAESAPRLTDQQLAHLRELLAIVEASPEDPLRWLEYDRLFHLSSYAAAPLPRVLAMIERFWNQTQQYRRAYFYTVRDHLEVVSAEHRLIMEALERRNGDDAASLQMLHIRRTRTTLAPHPELFHG
jgi:DNA-binding GntR family transcriptional regulator